MNRLLGFNTVEDATTFLRKYSTVPIDLDEPLENSESDLFGEDMEMIIQAVKETNEKKIFEERKEKGDIKEDFALILNPKHKDIIPELWYKAGLYMPIVWSPFAEEGKCYVVTDKNFVRIARANMQSVFGLPGWNKRNIPIKKEE